MKPFSIRNKMTACLEGLDALITEPFVNSWSKTKDYVEGMGWNVESYDLGEEKEITTEDYARWRAASDAIKNYVDTFDLMRENAEEDIDALGKPILRGEVKESDNLVEKLMEFKTQHDGSVGEFKQKFNDVCMDFENAVNNYTTGIMNLQNFAESLDRSENLLETGESTIVKLYEIWINIRENGGDLRNAIEKIAPNHEIKNKDSNIGAFYNAVCSVIETCRDSAVVLDLPLANEHNFVISNYMRFGEDMYKCDTCGATHTTPEAPCSECGSEEIIKY